MFTTNIQIHGHYHTINKQTNKLINKNENGEQHTDWIEIWVTLLVKVPQTLMSLKQFLGDRFRLPTWPIFLLNFSTRTPDAQQRMDECEICAWPTKNVKLIEKIEQKKRTNIRFSKNNVHDTHKYKIFRCVPYLRA